MHIKNFGIAGVLFIRKRSGIKCRNLVFTILKITKALLGKVHPVFNTILVFISKFFSSKRR